jgi:hypothetical protein
MLLRTFIAFTLVDCGDSFMATVSQKEAARRNIKKAQKSGKA